MNKTMKLDSKVMVTRSAMPEFEEYVNMIKPLWETHWLTNMGVYHAELEEKLKNYLNVKEVSLTVNGHMALELAIQAMDFPVGGEVITTPFTFISTTHAIVRNNLAPVFADIKMDDYTIDESKIEDLITEKTVAIVPVHVYGNVCNVEKIEGIAKKHGLKVIYDAAHAFGVKYKNRGIGEFGDATIFSFHATKVFNTIEGGAVCTKNRELYDKIYNLKNFGIRGEDSVIEIGANAKMNEFQAAMGICNLKYVEKNLENRKKAVLHYRSQLADMEGISILKEQTETYDNYAYFPVLINPKVFGTTRDEVYDYLKSRGIFTRKYFYPLTSDQQCFSDVYKNCSLENARYCSKNILVLPLYAGVKIEVINTVCKYISEIRKRIV